MNDETLRKALRERDDAQEWADRLAYAIAPVEVIGEHSNLNNPWQNALDELPSAPDLITRAEAEAYVAELVQRNVDRLSAPAPTVDAAALDAAAQMVMVAWDARQERLRLVEDGTGESMAVQRWNADLNLSHAIQALRAALRASAPGDEG